MPCMNEKARKVYCKPLLARYGTISEVTESEGLGSADMEEGQCASCQG